MQITSDISKVFLVFFIVSALGISSPEPAFAESPWQVEFVGGDKKLDSPMLKVKKISLKNSKIQPLSDDKFLWAIVNAFKEKQIIKAKSEACTAAWSQFNNAFGVAGNVSTFAEQAMFIGSLAKINGYFTKIGTALGLFQVALDIVAEDHRSALINSYKTVQGYWLGTVGTSAMQIGSVAAFVVDYWLTDVRETTWLNHKNQLRKVYSAFYQDTSNAERRDINEWKVIIYKIYKKSRRAKTDKKKQSYFQNRLNAEIDNYITKFWKSRHAIDYIAENKHLRQFHRINNENKLALQDEFRIKLMQQFNKEVFPEIAQLAWNNWAKTELRYMNMKTNSLLAELNKVLKLEIRAYGLKQATKFRIQKSNGKFWKGTIQPGKNFIAKMTKMAFIKAGFPHKVSLLESKKMTTKSFEFEKDKAVITFGTPPVSVITTYDRSESEQICNVKRFKTGEKVEKFSETRVARSGSLHMSTSTSGQSIIGWYSTKENKWLEAAVSLTISKSPTQINKNSNLDDLIKITEEGMKVKYSLSFSPPYFEDIKALENCKGTISLLGRSDISCKAKRYKRKKVSRNTLIERHCTSSITLKSKNYFMVTGEHKGMIIDSKSSEMNEQEISKGYKGLQNHMKDLPKQ